MLNYLQDLQDIRLIAACRDRRRLQVAFRGEIREGDIRDDRYLASLFDGVDVAVNAMAWTSLWGHRRQSEQLFLQPSLSLVDHFDAMSRGLVELPTLFFFAASMFPVCPTISPFAKFTTIKSY